MRGLLRFSNRWRGFGISAEEWSKDVEKLKAGDGCLIGVSGFKEFKLEKGHDGEVPGANTGTLIDHHFARRGLAWRWRRFRLSSRMDSKS